MKSGVSNPERVSAGLLLAFTVIAIAWSNAPFGDTYGEFWNSIIDLRVAEAHLELTFHDLVNDGLMAFFFFQVGLEVKREFTIGDLTDRSRALVPVVAAVAGLLVPAGVFLVFNPSGENAQAWGVVISTDTAFLVGALAIIGPKFPARLRVFLLTLAVVDDVGALAVIAVFYTAGLQLLPFLLALLLLIAVALVRFLPAGRGPAYAFLAVATWLALFASGVHPTLAGVGIALLIPVYPPRRREVERTMELTRAFRQSPTPGYAAAASRSLRDSISINERLQNSYGPYIWYFVLPLFALANAGVKLNGATLAAAAVSPLTWGIIAGLVLGKFIGITGATALVRRLGIGRLAPGLTLDRIAGGAALSGIGFTISLFIVDLAIDDPLKQHEARVGVLAASLLAFLLGWVIFAVLDRFRPPAAIGKTLVRPFDPERDHFKGDPEAVITLVEYGDFECPFCSRATGSIDEVIAHYGGRIRVVWRHLPLTRIHPHAVEAALASEAAAMQGAFFKLAPTLFSHQDHLEYDDLVGYADQLGLDLDQFRSDMRSATVQNRVEDDILDAELMDLQSTPTFFIGNTRHHGPYDAASLIRALDRSATGEEPGVPRD
ncbi:Na+/H+ antiporter NhaA [Glaciibacter superstes]|uniref:Na+/H+ antiporter NhaA n=1 Tax=Glaciibacter superstes TaxID=501023 RepID=UPI0003B36BC3|nr:Na+/H+ antiporter NhaA [Glaciibacter superstes]